MSAGSQTRFPTIPDTLLPGVARVDGSKSGGADEAVGLAHSSPAVSPALSALLHRTVQEFRDDPRVSVLTLDPYLSHPQREFARGLARQLGLRSTILCGNGPDGHTAAALLLYKSDGGTGYGQGLHQAARS
eukprot:RCo009927